MNPPPPIPAPEGEVPPHHECYALIETDDDGEESATFYSSTAARDDATLEAIWFGGPDDCHKEEAEAYLETLREKGILTFEGYPPLRWETMYPKSLLSAEKQRGLRAVEEARAAALEEAADDLLEASEDFEENVDAPALLVDYLREKAQASRAGNEQT